MTNKELTKLSSELETCGKVLLRIAETLQAMQDEKTAES